MRVRRRKPGERTTHINGVPHWICRTCGIAKPKDAFNLAGVGVPNSYCKPCLKVHSARYASIAKTKLRQARAAAGLRPSEPSRIFNEGAYCAILDSVRELAKRLEMNFRQAMAEAAIAWVQRNAAPDYEEGSGI